MANLILTNCDFLVPIDRVCFGSPGYKEQGLCEKCQIYSENRKPKSYSGLGRVFGVKKPNVFHHGKIRITQEACGVKVEAIT